MTTPTNFTRWLIIAIMWSTGSNAKKFPRNWRNSWNSSPLKAITGKVYLWAWTQAWRNNCNFNRISKVGIWTWSQKCRPQSTTCSSGQTPTHEGICNGSILGYATRNIPAKRLGSTFATIEKLVSSSIEAWNPIYTPNMSKEAEASSGNRQARTFNTKNSRRRKISSSMMRTKKTSFSGSIIVFLLIISFSMRRMRYILRTARPSPIAKWEATYNK